MSNASSSEPSALILDGRRDLRVDPGLGFVLLESARLGDLSDQELAGLEVEASLAMRQLRASYPLEVASVANELGQFRRPAARELRLALRDPSLPLLVQSG